MRRGETQFASSPHDRQAAGFCSPLQHSSASHAALPASANRATRRLGFAQKQHQQQNSAYFTTLLVRDAAAFYNPSNTVIGSRGIVYESPRDSTGNRTVTISMQQRLNINLHFRISQEH
jgi:hypothetical protein